MKEPKYDKALREYVCPVCGKTFIPAPCHIYKDKFKTNRNVCSWGCVCESERLKEASKKQSKTGGGS